MHRINILKFLTNFFVILLCLLELPFIGIVLIIIRLVQKRNDYLGYFLVLAGFLSLLPNFFNKYYALNFLTDNLIIKHLYSSASFVIGTGIIVIIVNVLLTKLKVKVVDIIELERKRSYKMNKENNLLIKEKQERAKNTHVVICPYCGSNNILTSSTGKCRHCRNNLEN